MSVKVFNKTKRGWLSEIRQHILSDSLGAVLLKKESNAYLFGSYNEAKEWIDKLENYKDDEWLFYEGDKLISKNMQRYKNAN